MTVCLVSKAFKLSNIQLNVKLLVRAVTLFVILGWSGGFGGLAGLGSLEWVDPGVLVPLSHSFEWLFLLLCEFTPPDSDLLEQVCPLVQILRVLQKHVFPVHKEKQNVKRVDSFFGQLGILARLQQLLRWVWLQSGVQALQMLQDRWVLQGLLRSERWRVILCLVVLFCLFVFARIWFLVLLIVLFLRFVHLRSFIFCLVLLLVLALILLFSLILIVLVLTWHGLHHVGLEVLLTIRALLVVPLRRISVHHLWRMHAWMLTHVHLLLRVRVVVHRSHFNGSKGLLLHLLSLGVFNYLATPRILHSLRVLLLLLLLAFFILLFFEFSFALLALLAFPLLSLLLKLQPFCRFLLPLFFLHTCLLVGDELHALGKLIRLKLAHLLLHRLKLTGNLGKLILPIIACAAFNVPVPRRRSLL